MKLNEGKSREKCQLLTSSINIAKANTSLFLDIALHWSSWAVSSGAKYLMEPEIVW